jgi:hypothetical protein
MIVQLAGKREEAIRHYCKALDIDPDYPAADEMLYLTLGDKLQDGSTPMNIESVNEDGSFVLVVRDPCQSATGKKKRAAGERTRPY